MKNYILSIFLLAGLFLAGCSKQDTNCKTVIGTVPASEVTALQQYLTTKGIAAEQDDRGFFYKIEAQGNGNFPTACSDVTVNYRGTLTDGTIFDENKNIRFNLGNLIKGWQAGIPLISEGGKITLYLPPSLGYGATPTAGIPANSILIFSIDLIRVAD